jgi:hypothetical protein
MARKGNAARRFRLAPFHLDRERLAIARCDPNPQRFSRHSFRPASDWVPIWVPNVRHVEGREGVVGEEGCEAGAEAGQVGVELDRAAVKDEQRLEDPLARIGHGVIVATSAASQRRRGER